MNVVAVAKDYAGNVQEIGTNAGVTDKALEALMRTTGWRSGLPWCMAFALAVWLRAAFTEAMRHQIRQLGIGTQAAWKKAESLGFKTSRTPTPGAIAIFQSINDPSRGHAAVVIYPHGEIFYTVEGNTDEAGTSEGDGVFARQRQLDFSKAQGSLRLLGFIEAPFSVSIAGTSWFAAGLLTSAVLGSVWAHSRGHFKKVFA